MYEKLIAVSACVQLPPRGFWVLQYRETRAAPEEPLDWKAYAGSSLDMCMRIDGLEPGTSYDFRVCGGFIGTADVKSQECNFSVPAKFSTTGKCKRPPPEPEPLTQKRGRNGRAQQSPPKGSKAASKTVRLVHCRCCFQRAVVVATTVTNFGECLVQYTGKSMMKIGFLLAEPVTLVAPVSIHVYGIFPWCESGRGGISSGR